MKLNQRRFAITGDLHIGLHLSNSMWHGISLEFAKWFKQKLIEEKITDIIILGDIVDNRNDISVPTIHTLNQFFHELEDFNIIIIAGNHDCYYSKRSDVNSICILDNWPNITVLNQYSLFDTNGAKMSFCPWGTDIDSIKPSDIILGHFEINTYVMSGRALCVNRVDPNALLAKSPTIFSGHFHDTESRVYKNGRITYAGSPYEQNWGECQVPKGFYIHDINSKETTFIENEHSPRHIRIHLSELLKNGVVNEAVKKSFNGNIIHFVVDSEFDQDAISALAEKLYLLAPRSLKIELIGKEAVETNEEIQQAFDGINIREDIRSFIDSVDIQTVDKDDLKDHMIKVFESCKGD